MADPITLVTLTDPLAPASEAYRSLRMNLQFAALDRPLRTLLVTSPGQGEGKSTCLANLAVTMAQVEQRVIAVDCDLRRPHLHVLLGLCNEVGFTTMMLDERALQAPPLQATAVNDLRALTSGPLPPRPADLLGSKRMELVIARLLEEADLLLFDAPPLMAAADATVLAAKVDGVLLVVSAGETKREAVQRSIERLRKVNANIVGAVLNNAPLDADLQADYR
ncbi:MAG: CpsD/CapB family tyrosine-protein kinase [Chloroflexota bacterium]